MADETTAQPEPKADERLTIDELAELTGNVRTEVPNATFGGGSGPARMFSREHLAAAQLHGWAAHPMHSAEPLRIAKADYLAALKAAAEYPVCDLHAPAASPFSPHKPRKAGSK